jgi:Flp pilus assembly protein TadB
MLDRPQGLLPEDTEEAFERDEAARTGWYVFAGAALVAVLTVIGWLTSSQILTLVAAGIALALFVVAMLLIFDGERQRKRDAAPRVQALQCPPRSPARERAKDADTTIRLR